MAEPTRQGLIDDFAGLAMQSLLRNPPFTGGPLSGRESEENRAIAKRAFAVARTMLDERDRILDEDTLQTSRYVPQTPTSA